MKKLFLFGFSDIYGQVSPAYPDQRWFYGFARASNAYVVDTRELLLYPDRYTKDNIIIYLTINKTYIEYIYKSLDKFTKYWILQGFREVDINALDINTRQKFIHIIKKSAAVFGPKDQHFDISDIMESKTYYRYPFLIDFQLINQLTSKTKAGSENIVTVFGNYNLHKYFANLASVPNTFEIHMEAAEANKTLTTMFDKKVVRFTNKSPISILNLIKKSKLIINCDPWIDDAHYRVIAQHFGIDYIPYDEDSTLLENCDLYKYYDIIRQVFKDE